MSSDVPDDAVPVVDVGSGVAPPVDAAPEGATVELVVPAAVVSASLEGEHAQTATAALTHKEIPGLPITASRYHVGPSARAVGLAEHGGGVVARKRSRKTLRVAPS